MARTKILVVDRDLDTLTKIYLALLHRNFKVEATDKEEEITQRLKRMRPAIIVLEAAAYIAIEASLKIAAVVLKGKNAPPLGALPGDVIAIDKPVQVEALLQAVEQLVI